MSPGDFVQYWPIENVDFAYEERRGEKVEFLGMTVRGRAKIMFTPAMYGNYSSTLPKNLRPFEEVDCL